MARATNDLNAVRMMLGPGVMYCLESGFDRSAFHGRLCFPSIGGSRSIAVLPAPLTSVVVMRFGRAIHRRFERIQAMFSDISSRVQENLAGVRVVRAYVQERFETEEFEKNQSGLHSSKPGAGANMRACSCRYYRR